MLWIITQDKKQLIKAIEVSIDGKKIEGVFSAGLLDSNILGKYESKERAVEVLNEIFTKIEESTSFSVTFTMPEQ